MRGRDRAVNGQMAPPASARALIRRCVERDDRGNDVDNRLRCEADVTNLVDKSLDAVTSQSLLLVLPEGATNI